MGKAVIWSDFWSGLNMPENPFVDIRLTIQLLILAAFFSRICLPLSKWEQNLLSFQGFRAGQYFVSFCKYCLFVIFHNLSLGLIKLFNTPLMFWFSDCSTKNRAHRQNYIIHCYSIYIHPIAVHRFPLVNVPKMLINWQRSTQKQFHSVM